MKRMLRVENNLRRAHQSIRCILVKDAGREKMFASPSVGFARAGHKMLGKTEDDRLFSLVDDDWRADGGILVAPLKLARVVDQTLLLAAHHCRFAVVSNVSAARRP